MLWSALSGSAVSYAASHHLEAKGGLILTAQDAEAQIVAREMAYFVPKLNNRIIYIPERETLPFDLEKTSANILSARAFEFERVFSGNVKDPIIVSSTRNAMGLFSGQGFWSEKINLNVGDALPEDMETQLVAWGYSRAFRTKTPGDFSARGRVIDIFPVGGVITTSGYAHHPLRVTVDAKQIITKIKKLDPLTQESSGIFSSAVVFPFRDYAFNRAIVENFRKYAYENNPDPRSSEVYKQVSRGEDHPELAWWMSYSQFGSASLFDIPGTRQIVLLPGAMQSAAEYDRLIELRHAEVCADSSRIIPYTAAAFLGASVLEDKIKDSSLVEVHYEPRDSGVNYGFVESGMVRMASLSDSLVVLETLVKKGGYTLFVIKSEVRQKHMEVMCSMLGYTAEAVDSFDEFISRAATHTTDPQVFISRGDIISGYSSPVAGYRIITEREIFGSVIETGIDDEISEHQRRIILQGLHDIETGEPMVHALNGVGRFAGFERLNLHGTDGYEEDVVKIAYAEEAIAFVRIRDLDLVSRYSGGSPEKAPLSKLNDPSWMKGIREAQESAYSAAVDLVKIKEERAKSVGIALKPSDVFYDRFCDVFVYEETPDQRSAINDVISDLTSGRPMDRLICGDVGFGKTEVAMRAAFLAAHQGYQVVVLAPTTILAGQHFESFLSRFEETSIKIALANRNSLSKKDMSDIKSGKASIIVGTHRLLQNDIEFKNLGLIIVDEEHRFGVKQKEQLREMRANKHMLTMTATPIPRTLGMAIAGIRDVSIIATPPARRLSVRTIVKKMADDALRLALTRELSRSGQIFYLHNRIETMDDCVQHLQALMPDARIRKIHGQQSEMDMARTMMDFRNHQFDVLVSTTVIEIGIDVPNANTLIVEDADRLGLGQLHQLRGRVGRSSRQAYAYLLHNDQSGSNGMRRLEAMVKASNLGEGVMIARHDMEIRGIGEILGEEQSGHVHNIGFTLYMRLLEQCVKSITQGSDVDRGLLLNTVEMPVEGRIPADFIEETGERLAWYQRLMSSERHAELDRNLAELNDLYGYLPGSLTLLKESVEDHILLRNWGIRKIEQNKTGVDVVLHDDCPRETPIMIALTFKGVHNKKVKGKTYFIDNANILTLIGDLRKNSRVQGVI